MKIYFNATPIGKREGLEENYIAIYNTIKDLGHRHCSDFVLKSDLDSLEKQNHEESVEFYKKMIREMNQSDLVILEVSRHSTGIGHQASLALTASKPLIALHLEMRSPYLLNGIQNDRLILTSYDLPSLKNILEDAIEYAQGLMDTRFNFFIPPKIQQYLDWITKHKRKPRAVYLRELLERDMRQNKDWKKQEVNSL